MTSDIDKHVELRKRYESMLRNFIAKEELQAFPAATVNEYPSDGIEALLAPDFVATNIRYLLIAQY